MSDSLRPHELQYARPPCPSPTRGVHPNSCALSWWCHPIISSSVVPFSSCPQSFPASGSFQMSQLSHQVAKYWSFICSVSSSNEYSGLNFLRMELVWSPCNPVQFSSVTQSCLTLCDPMSCSTPALPVHHQLPEFTQTHVHRVGDAIQPSHPLSSPSPPAPNPSQHQGLFQWVSSLHEVAKVLEFQLQHLSFQWTPRTDFL